MAADANHNFGPAPPATPPMTAAADQPPVLPPLDFEQPTDKIQFSDWNGRVPSPAATILEEPTNLELAAMLEHRYRAWLDAINAKDFGPTSVLWQNITPTWKSSRNCNYIRDAPDHMDIHEFVDSMVQGSKHQPNVHIHALDCTTNLYRNDNGKIEFAETFLNVEVSGAPPGITRRSVAVHNTRLIGGKWLSTGHKSITGMVVMGPDAMY